MHENARLSQSTVAISLSAIVAVYKASLFVGWSTPSALHFSTPPGWSADASCSVWTTAVIRMLTCSGQTSIGVGGVFL